jgi:hypothetical protein
VFDLINVVALLEVLHICIGCTFLQLAVHPSARAVVYYIGLSLTYACIIFIVAPCNLKSMLFTQQQMHYLLNLEKFKIYTEIMRACLKPIPD